MTVRVRDVAVPTEHGGWSFVFEPVLLGLIVAWSGAGVALGLCAMLALLARTPLKLALGDRWRRRRLARTVVAEKVAAGYLALLLASLVVAFGLAEAPFWPPLAAAAPLVGLEFWFDIRSRSRRLAAEMAGTIGIGSVAAAIVLAAGGNWTAAAAVWLVAGCRAVATVPFVRLQLRRAKGQAHSVVRADAAQLLAVVAAASGGVGGVLPWTAVGAVGALTAIHVVLSRLPVPRTAMLGAQQVVLGLALVVTAGLAIAAP